MDIIYHIYSKDSCKYCFQAIALLTQKKLPFKEFKLGREFTREELLERFPSAQSFPQIEVHVGNNVTYIGGFDQLQQQLS